MSRHVWYHRAVAHGILAGGILWACAADSSEPGPGPGVQGPRITINADVTHQTIIGWEGVAQIGHLPFDCNPVAFQNHKSELLDRVVHELGLNRVRLEVKSGMENPYDAFSAAISGQINGPSYRARFYDIVNDNNDPNVINPAGFYFGALDAAMDEIVLPMRMRLQAMNESLYLNMTYVDFGSSAFEHYSNPQEYAEFIVAAFQHLQSRYGFVPDGLEVILEPDEASGWGNGTRIGQVLVAAAQRLAAAGFHPEFIAPSTASAERGVNYFNTMRNVAGVMNYLTEVSYHRYGGTGAVSEFGDIAEQYGVRTAMLEHLEADHHELHDDLTLGRVSAWEQYSIAFCSGDTGTHYYSIYDSNPQNPVIEIGDRTRYLSQYFREVRRGAVRIDASSEDSALEPVAFVNTNGRTVVVVKASRASPFHIVGLPAGRYGVRYTTDAEFARELSSITIPAGGALSTAIPDDGVITIYRQ